VLAGGTGGAKLAAGFDAVLPAGDLTVVANTADDQEFWGLLVCPDIDAVIYRLAGVFDEHAGYGQRDETVRVLDALGRLGEDTWFRLGDKDLATHIQRTDMIRRGLTLTETSLEQCRRFGIRSRVVPMSDQPVRTRCITDEGNLSLQEYFVRDKLRPALRGIELNGLQHAHPSHAAINALGQADLVVVGPSNPLVSIDPIVKVLGDHIPRAKTVAVTPLVGGVALKGPTVEMMRALGLEVSPMEVARRYRDVCSGFVLDEVDAQLAPAIRGFGLRVDVLPTVMDDGGVRLARALLLVGC
jgi:LPPG:FO 2-phospho-L-lactate transferase